MIEFRDKFIYEPRIVRGRSIDGGEGGFTTAKVNLNGQALKYCIGTQNKIARAREQAGKREKNIVQERMNAKEKSRNAGLRNAKAHRNARPSVGTADQ